MYKSSAYKTCLSAVIMLILLTIFCLANLSAGTAPYYLCIFSLMINIPFTVYLIYTISKENKSDGDTK